MKGSRRSPLQVVRDLRPSDERREAKKQRDAEKHSREAERLAARTAAEARRHSSQHGA
jgi:hypothetical protein